MASPPATPSSQPHTQNPSTKERILILITDLYKLAQLDEDVLTQFDDVLTKAHEGLHHKLEALDQYFLTKWFPWQPKSCDMSTISLLVSIPSIHGENWA